jgi:hypothetical protein
MKKMKAIPNAIALICLGMIMSHCTPVSVLNTSCATYKNPTLAKLDLAKAHTAILPVLAGGEWEGFRRPAGDKLYEAFSMKYGKDIILSPLQTLDLINQSNLADKYSSLIDTYQRSGILNKETLKNLGESLNSDYLLYTRIDNSESFKTLEAGNNRYVAQINEVTFYAQCWDTKKGDIAWEGIGGAAGSNKTEGSDVNSLIKTAAIGLVDRLEMTPTDQPPCNTTDALAEQMSSNYLLAYIGTLLGSTLFLLILLAML